MLAARMHRAKSFISGQTGKADASPPLVPVMAAVRDMRPVDVVVHAAAASVGAQDNAAPAVKAIREHGVHWAFQLAQAGAEDWPVWGRGGRPGGLKTRHQGGAAASICLSRGQRGLEAHARGAADAGGAGRARSATDISLPARSPQQASTPPLLVQRLHAWATHRAGSRPAEPSDRHL